MPHELEQPLIRPPSESRSVLVRLTRGCKWNRCRFCGIYPNFGEPDFSLRPISELRKDIDRLKEIMPHAETAFIGDSDPLQAGLDAFLDTAAYLHENFSLARLTCYARTSTLYRLKQRAVKRLAGGGLKRVHIGLESGDPAILRFQRKGQSPEMVKTVSRWLKDAGIEISFYVLLGLAGKDGWEKHILETARLINATEPEFLRLRRLWIYGRDEMCGESESPLWAEIRDGRFTPQTPEGTVQELRLLLEHLDDRLSTYLVSDHANNYVHVAGVLRKDRKEMLSVVDEFLARPKSEREAHYRAVGSGM